VCTHTLKNFLAHAQVKLLVQRAKNNGDLDDLGVIDSSGEVTSAMPPVGASNGQPPKQRSADIGDDRLVQRLEALQKTNETLTKQVSLQFQMF
jgi:hypothetical protein